MNFSVLFIGSYTSPGRGEGILACRQNVETGELSALALEKGARSPSFLCLSPDRTILYAVNEEGKPGSASSYRIDRETGRLDLVSQVSSEGEAPCHLCTSPDGSFVFVANYGDGSVACLPAGPDGRLKPASAVRRNPGGNAHWVGFDPTGQFLLSVDKGRDVIDVLRTTDGRILAHDPGTAELPDGTGPRHLAFHPNGHIAYVNGEKDLSAMVLGFDGERGTFEPLQKLPTLPVGAKGEGFSTAEIAVHPNGKHLFVSNRGLNSLARFAIEPDGRLRALGHLTVAANPRHFAFDPAGRFLYVASQDDDRIDSFRYVERDGSLTRTDFGLRSGSPVCILFLGHEIESSRT